MLAWIQVWQQEKVNDLWVLCDWSECGLEEGELKTDTAFSGLNTGWVGRDTN